MSNPYGEWVPDPLAPSGFRWRRNDEVEPTSMLPIITPPTAEHGGTVEYAGHTDHALRATLAAGVNDDLVQATFNGLRPDDLALEQPPQDPDWRPDGDR